MLARLHAFDLSVVALYLVAITLFGLRFAKKGAARDKSLRAYFLADKTVPWWAIALSIVSAETSTLTIIGTPGLAFAGDFGFLQIVMGYMLGRIVVAAIFLPRYIHGEMLTAYQLIERRFGRTLYKVTAGLFLLTRATAEGVRVYAVSIVVAIAIGTGDVLSIAIISALTLLYTFEGGMAAVIWTDVVQMAIYVGGTIVALWSLGHHIPGGWATIHAVAGAAGKFHLWNFALNLTTTYTFWAGVLGGTFLTMASHGTDQLMVQRMLAARNLRESQVALLSSGIVIFAQFTMFLLIGAGLWVFYGLHPEALAAIGGANGNRLFPSFIVTQMPIGVAGLLVAAILAAAMSNLSAALNSLSSTTVVDFYMGWKPQARDEERMLVSRASTILWALVLFAVAVYSVRAGGKGNVVEIGLSIASVAYGCLLGVFLLGTLTTYATQTGAIVGMVTGFVTNLLLWKFPGKVLWTGDLMYDCTPGQGSAETISLSGCKVPHISIPNVAFSWYVLIGAAVTFAVGMAASSVLRNRKTAARSKVAATLMFVVILCVAARTCDAQSKNPDAAGSTKTAPTLPASNSASTTYDFSAVSADIKNAIADKKLPGAVVLVGHNGRIVFQQAYGVRKYAGEPGLDGKPSPAEPMTLDTIFDMASLTKVLVTSVAVMQLVEQGKVDVDAPVAKYLPEFAVNGAGFASLNKDKVTVRMLLTHYSGLPADVDLKDSWGLARRDKAEGIRRAMESKLESTPGTHFEYSDVNYITLGALVEKLSGERLDEYAEQHIFGPLAMTHTRYLPGTGLMGQIAPTQHDSEGTPETNPGFDHLLRGTVHDPTTRRMDGVAGHAGVFSTATDTAKFAQALLDKLLRNTGPFPLKQSTLQAMVHPQQPATALGGATIFNQDGSTTTGIAQRGFGWDLNSAYTRPRGTVFPLGVSFGHTGFTGTSIWIDPASDTYVILLANSVHPRGGPNISPLRGQVATDAALALGLAPPSSPRNPSATNTSASVSTGIDVLESTGFAQLKTLAPKPGGVLRLGLLTNQTGLDSAGHRTIDILRNADHNIKLTRLFSPEHGILGVKDSTNIGPEIDPTSGITVTSLYGAKDADRRPRPHDLADLDGVVIDLQDAGVRFYTYETVLGYFIEASACEAARGHTLHIVVLDRPALLGGLAVQGPVSDTPATNINYMPEPVRNGMTLGELAMYMRSGHPGSCAAAASVDVVKMQHWNRSQFFDQTGVRWVNPSPNLRSLREAVLYPGLGMLDYTNVSVGRGTDTPFAVFGAAWIDGARVASYLSARSIPGVQFSPTSFHVADTSEKYPGHGQTVAGVQLQLTDRNALDSPELGIEILSAIHHLYPAEFQLQKAFDLVANTATMQALARGDDPRTIAAQWQPAIQQFRQKREKHLLYR